jgi:hypothetical protein
MRKLRFAMILIGVAAISCNRHPQKTQREEPAAREAGREAYHASQDIKRGAKEAAGELRKAGREFRQGWNEARRQQPPSHDNKPQH